MVTENIDRDARLLHKQDRLCVERISSGRAFPFDIRPSYEQHGSCENEERTGTPSLKAI